MLNDRNTSVGNDLQRCENKRIKFFLNYKSVAVSGGATGAELAEASA
jgi:hypothetical protein